MKKSKVKMLKSPVEETKGSISDMLPGHLDYDLNKGNRDEE